VQISQRSKLLRQERSMWVHARCMPNPVAMACITFSTRGEQIIGSRLEILGAQAVSGVAPDLFGDSAGAGRSEDIAAGTEPLAIPKERAATSDADDLCRNDVGFNAEIGKARRRR
jgi:hypothetical protein